MQSPGTRAISLGGMIFLGMLVAKLISGETFTLRVLLGPAVGGIVGGLFVYILGIILAKKKP